jgi:hypothetical protein
MKNGGWLDSYDDELQLGGYVYPTNYVPQAENGIEGTMGGLTDQGFNYNGAWGGPSMQFGGVLNFLEPTSKKLPEGYNPKAKGSSTEYATSIGGEDGELAYLIPEFKYGKLLDDPKTEFRRTGDYLGGPFKTWQEADEWERTVRHPYVEKGQNIPTPFRRWGKDFAMGGSLPGAVGFTYARTGGIPSNGPYAKKTKASAQNGMEMKFYQEGLDWKPRNISKQGSKIKKDDNGYWNPENWGEPVEIGSNEITMQGVYEPLLGISDTGDTQMMYPGEDYTFDGESVIEYPVMQQGGRTPIYTDNPKDPRIRAYNDSLSLYNQTQHNLKPYKTSGWPSSLLEKQLQKYWPSEISSMKANPNDIGWYARNSENNSPTGTGETSTTTSRFKNKINPKILPVGQYLIKTSDNAADFIPKYKKPVQPVEYKKPEPKKEVKKPEPVKKEQPKPIERKQNIYEGSPVYSPGAGTGMGSALIGFANQKGDTTYIKPEDYERFAVPKYGKEFIESKTKKKNGGWLDRYN